MRPMRRAVLGVVLGFSVLGGIVSGMVLSSLMQDRSQPRSVTVIDRDGKVWGEQFIYHDPTRPIVILAIALVASVLLAIYCYRQLTRRPLR
jgi:hypothetical protein